MPKNNEFKKQKQFESAKLPGTDTARTMRLLTEPLCKRRHDQHTITMEQIWPLFPDRTAYLALILGTLHILLCSVEYS